MCMCVMKFLLNIAAWPDPKNRQTFLFQQNTKYIQVLSNVKNGWVF